MAIATNFYVLRGLANDAMIESGGFAFAGRNTSVSSYESSSGVEGAQVILALGVSFAEMNIVQSWITILEVELKWIGWQSRSSSLLNH